MSIKKYYATKDNSITNAFKENLATQATSANMGGSDILEVFSIYGQASSSSVEKQRIIIEFPVNTILSDRSSNKVPSSGSVNFVLKMSNAAHAETLPRSFSLSVSPLLASWDEGLGLDMERYTDTGGSSWISASLNTLWVTEGAPAPISSRMASTRIPVEYIQSFDSGLENLEVDITPFVEEKIFSLNGQGTKATGSVQLSSNPEVGKTITLFATEGDNRTVQISTSSATSGKIIYVERGADIPATATNLAASIDSDVLFSAQVNSGNNQKVDIVQASAGFYGNTKISSSISDATLTNFANAVGITNYGYLIKLSDAFEDGSRERSYYTKRFFARSSEFFFKRPSIEARFDLSRQDDRSFVFASSSLVPLSENQNTIFLYNKIRGSLVDIPDTGSHFLVQLRRTVEDGESIVTLPVDGTNVMSGAPTFITASRHEKGVYKATFQVPASGQFYDFWTKCKNKTGASPGAPAYTTLVTGSGFTAIHPSSSFYKEGSEYVVNITNLKSLYSPQEKATFRVYTRSKDSQPNIYTVASNKAPVSNIKEGYYKIKRKADNLTVIPYSTASNPSYSKLSYDVSGSYFDLDMSILEPNYLYEISFLRKDQNDYVEQKEKFKFRVDTWQIIV